jgi:hypothetical protein
MPDPIAPPEPQPELPIPIEETPEIPMDMPAPQQSQVPPPAPMPTARGSPVLTILIVIILAVAGIFLSNYIRPLLSGMNTGTPQGPTPTLVAATPTPVDPFAGWNTAAVAGISYKLPPDVLAPACDVAGCISQGTYLPGGTRLTVSAKTVTQALSSLLGAAITDAAGTAFNSHDASVSAHTAIEFTGTFAGRTTGGFGFSQMHGFMIEVTPTLTLEINHFTPQGIVADFAKDDALFTQIISTLSFDPSLPIGTATPVPATPSGN